MKRCPECAAGFPDSFDFCERDGTPLVSDFLGDSSELSDSQSEPAAATFDHEPIEELQPTRSASTIHPYGVVPGSQSTISGDRLQQNLKSLALMLVMGVAIGLVLLVGYLLMTRETKTNANEPIATGALKQQPVPVLPLRTSSIESESPSPEPSPSPSVTPSPSPEVEAAPLSLSSGMVSTGSEEKTGHGPVTIRLTNGNTVEADEAWQTADGIWYRRHGVATLLDRNAVKTIERADEKKSPAPASPAPTPTSTRTASP